MKKILLTLSVLLSVFASPLVKAQTKIPLMVNANGTLIAISAGGTTNFFLANSNQLNQVIAALGYSTTGGGGGGTYTPYFSTNNLNLALTNFASGSVLSNNVVITNGNSPSLNLWSGTGQGSQIVTKIGNTPAWDIVQSTLGIQFQDTISGNTMLALDSSDNTHVNYNLAVGGTIAGLGSGLTNAQGYSFADTNFVRQASNTVNNALVSAGMAISNILSTEQTGSAYLTNFSLHCAVDASGNLTANSLHSDGGLFYTSGGGIFYGVGNDVQGEIELFSSGSFKYWQAANQTGAGGTFLLQGTNNPNSQELVDEGPMAYNFPYSNDLHYFFGYSNRYAVVVRADGKIQHNGLWTGFTNITGLTSYAPDKADTIIGCNPALGGNCVITDPGLGRVADPQVLNSSWTFLRDRSAGGAPGGPYLFTAERYVENLGSNTASTLTYTFADGTSFTNLGSSSVVIPNQMGVHIRTYGTNATFSPYALSFSPTWNAQNMTNLPAANLTGTIPASALTGANLGGASNIIANAYRYGTNGAASATTNYTWSFGSNVVTTITAVNNVTLSAVAGGPGLASLIVSNAGSAGSVITICVPTNSMPLTTNNATIAGTNYLFSLTNTASGRIFYLSANKLTGNNSFGDIIWTCAFSLP
jgi:hypothetical protein